MVTSSSAPKKLFPISQVAYSSIKYGTLSDVKRHFYNNLGKI